MTMPAVAPPDSALLEGPDAETDGVGVEEARDAVFDVPVAVAVPVDVTVADAVEGGTEVDEGEGSSCARSKTKDVASGAADERDEYVSFILASVEFASRLSGRAQQMLIWSGSH